MTRAMSRWLQPIAVATFMLSAAPPYIIDGHAADEPVAEALRRAASPEDPCQLTGTCVVQGAEVDDATSLANRKRKGRGAAAGIVSDARVKADAKVVGKLPNGVPIYEFKFLWENQSRVGLMAQDLQSRDDMRAAVVVLPNGLLGIDYAGLGLRMASEPQWTADGLKALDAKYTGVTTDPDDEPVILFNRNR